MWWKDGVFYQVYPASFKDSDGDGMGDLNGITERLDYLNDGTPNSLGIDAIWITPFFRSPMRDFGYDISDYYDVDPAFGTLGDFRHLLSEAHKRGIHVILDMVFNHTSDEHPWFKESRRDRENPKADWYIWHPGRNGHPPNNWFSAFELKNAWRYEPSRGEFYLGTFTRHQPEVNWRSQGLKSEMLNIARYWLDMGVDGFRLDVVNWFVKDAGFRSNPFSLKSIDLQKHLYDRNQAESVDVCRELRKITDGYDSRAMVGEVYTDDPEIASRYYGNGCDALHMVFNFDFLFQPWDAWRFYKSAAEWYKILKGDSWPSFTLSNHDNLRHSYRYRRGKWTHARAKVAAAMLLTLRGTPFIYYGEELGMCGGRLKRSQLRDPLSRKTWPLKRFCRDMARTPMQWDAAKNAGFSGHQPWLPVSRDHKECNVELQDMDGKSLLNFYRSLIWLRKTTPCLMSGSIEFFEEYLPDMLVYFRSDNEDSVLVILNFSCRHAVLDGRLLSGSGLAGMETYVQLGSHRPTGDCIDLNRDIKIGPYEVLIVGRE